MIFNDLCEINIKKLYQCHKLLQRKAEMKIIDISSERPTQGLEEFQAEFLQDRNEEFLVVLDALKKEDYSQIKSYAHKWKGYCAPYGFNGLEYYSEKLEIAANDTDLKLCKIYIENIQNYLNEKESFLKEK